MYYNVFPNSMPSPLRPTESCDPYAVYRHAGGALNKQMANKRVAPTTACHERSPNQSVVSSLAAYNLMVVGYVWRQSTRPFNIISLFSREF